MTILKDIQQIEQTLQKFAKDGRFSSLDIDKFLSGELDENAIAALSSEFDGANTDKLDVAAEFMNLIFQLKQYFFPLKNVLNLLLHAKEFECTYVLVGKIFVSNFGQVKYASTQQQYTFVERYFDRFVEIVRNCQIMPQHYLPLVVAAINSKSNEMLFAWKRPAIEFMQHFYANNESWVDDFLSSSSEQGKHEIISAICMLNPNRGIFLIVREMQNHNSQSPFLLSLLKRHKQDAENYIDKNYQFATNDEKVVYINILSSFLPDTQSQARLEEKHKEERDEGIRELIASKISYTESLSIKSEKQFLYASRRKIKEPQQRAFNVVFERLDLKFASGLKASDTACTFVLHLLKEEKNLDDVKKLLVLGEIFQIDGLCDFAFKIFNFVSLKDDILFAKWAIRFVSLFHSSEQGDAIADFVVNLFEQGRHKEATYFLKCLCNNKNDTILKIFNQCSYPENEWFIALKKEIIEDYCLKNDKSIEDVYDELLNSDELDENKQIKRLFDAFVSGRELSRHNFNKNYLSNDVMLNLCQRLVWGEYQNGKLINTFIIKSDNICYLTQTNPEAKDVKIKIVHTLDIDDRFEKDALAVANPLFEQFKRSVFNIKDINNLAISANLFNGMFVNILPFCNFLTDNGFVLNKHEGDALFDGLILTNKALDILAEVTFEKTFSLSSPFATLGSIYFYKLSNVL